MRGREGGEEGEGGERGGRRKKWGWEEGEEVGRRERGGKKGGRGKRKILRTRSARRSRREEGDEGREGRGWEGEAYPPPPVYPIISNTLSPVIITLLHNNRMLTQWINEIYATNKKYIE